MGLKKMFSKSSTGSSSSHQESVINAEKRYVYATLNRRKADRQEGGEKVMGLNQVPRRIKVYGFLIYRFVVMLFGVMHFVVMHFVVVIFWMNVGDGAKTGRSVLQLSGHRDTG